MGLIKAGIGAVGGVLADQWKEFFYCDSISNEYLMVKGRKRTSSRSSNTKGEDNIISNGSVVAVADGQCMIIVEQGKIVEVCAEPGEFVYDSSTEPSIFAGSLGKSIVETFKAVGKRFTFGGDTGKDQRVYYFNTKEIIGNKFGTANPVPFRVVDTRANFDVDVSLRCNGIYSFMITDPLKFYTRLCGNVEEAYETEAILPTMKVEFISALGPALAKLSNLELRPNQIPAHSEELEQHLNEELASEWGDRGIVVVKVDMNPPTLTEEDQELLKTAQKTAMYTNLNMAGAAMVEANAEAMKTAAGNSAGAMTGFMGMGMAMNAGGNAMNPGQLFAMGQQQEAQKKAEAEAKAAAGAWKCACGAENTGKFCMECGSPKPAAEGWTCSCGAVNKGKFCSECGSKKPEGAPLYQCDKCGWKPEDPANPPKFCPECGDVFDGNDAK
ncbi:MAG: SPFH domain-containing protein [Clostridia bacterium]|nr:SPFH domain-containing protein [Clostridia bacterium]